MATAEQTVTAVLQAMCSLRGTFAVAPLEIKTRIAELTPPRSCDDFYGLDVGCFDDDGVSITAYLECTIDDVSNVWWLRAERKGDAAWEIARWVEVCWPDADEQVLRRFAPVVCASSDVLANTLAAAAKELLAIPPPSVVAP